MDFMLRCNSLKCRTQLHEKAVVTTCSHIFCTQCSGQLGLANTAASQRFCPACRTPLSNPDDVVETTLNPTEDYKTSVLSGLSPGTIMECAGRGLAFWTYQSNQEIIYQECIAKSLTDKFSNLNLQMDKVINDANSEIDTLNQRLSQMQLDQSKLKQDNQALINALREKNRKHQQTQELYDRLKRKEMTAATRHAAFDSVDDVLQSVNRAQPEPRSDNSREALRQFSAQRANHSPANLNLRNGLQDTGMMPPPAPRQGHFPIFTLPSELSGTPSNHRTRLGALESHGPSANAFPRSNGLVGANVTGQTPRIRRPLGSISGNSFRGGSGGYGLSAGMRAGSMQGYDNQNEYR